LASHTPGKLSWRDCPHRRNRGKNAYELPLTGYRVVSEGFDVVLVSSVAGARLREAIFNSWDKNDPKDASVIMRLLKQGMTQCYWEPLLMQTHDLQELSTTYHHIARAPTRLQHVLLTHYLTLYWPEIKRFWLPQRNEWVIRFLLGFPTPRSVTQLSLEAFANVVSPLIGRLARCSIALPMREGSPAVATFRMQLERYLQLCKTRNELEEQADALLGSSADYQQLKSLPGVGPIIALVILVRKLAK
jgi:hypothetical protein